MTLRNRVFPLTLTTLAPIHIGTGARLFPDVDYFVDGEQTYVLDTDTTLALVVERWAAAQPSPEEQRRLAEAALDEEEGRLQRRREQQIKRIEQFDQSPPRDPRKRQEQEQRLRAEVEQLRTLRNQLKARRAELAAAPLTAPAALPDALLRNSGLADLLTTGWLSVEDLRAGVRYEERSLVRYTLGGRASAGELYELIKDPADRLYLPGSSLKGAIRSALAWELAAGLEPPAFKCIDEPNEKKVDDKIEQALFLGRGLRSMNNTVRDVMRTLHVGDSRPVDVPPALLAVQVFQSRSATAPLAVEALPAGATLRATLQLERYPFESAEARKALDFDDWQARLEPAALAACCRRRAAALIAGERAYFARFPEAAEVARFYEELGERLAGLEPCAFLLPVGWGAGWRSKTLDDRLRGAGEDDEPFAQVVRRFRLKKHKSPSYQAGGSFPDTRKLALAGGRPWRPLGWLQVAIGAEGGR